MRDARHALVLGDGDGRFTARLLELNTHVQVDAVDASEVMLKTLLCRAGSHATRVHTRQIDARLWQPSGASYDLIVTHFFLDCLSTAEIVDLTRRLKAAVTPATRWALSDFAIPRGSMGRIVGDILIRGLYFGFGILTGLRQKRLPDYRKALEDEGFIQSRSKSYLGGLLVAELWRAPVPTL